MQAIKRVFAKSQQQPETFRSDVGKEFLGKEVKQYPADCEIYQQVMRNEKESQLCREGYTDIKEENLQIPIPSQNRDTLMSYKNSWKGYNEGYHSGIKRVPFTINKENEVQVWAEQYLPKKSVKLTKIKFKFSEGNLV